MKENKDAQIEELKKQIEELKSENENLKKSLGKANLKNFKLNYNCEAKKEIYAKIGYFEGVHNVMECIKKNDALMKEILFNKGE